MTNKKYKIKIEETAHTVRASAKTGNWLFGYEEVPFEMTYYKESQKDEYDAYRIGCHVEYDTEITCPEITFPGRPRTYWYKNGKFSGVSAGGVEVRDNNKPKIFHYVESEHINKFFIEKYEPIIRNLEERVGKSLIDR